MESQLEFQQGREDFEIPQRIRDLPEDDPERVRYFKGLKVKNRDAYSGEYLRFRIGPARSEGVDIYVLLRMGIVMAVLGVLTWGMVALFDTYVESLAHWRQEVRITLWGRGYRLEDPEVKTRFGALNRTNWLPAVQELHAQALEMPIKRRESEGQAAYLGYLRRTGKPFDDGEAMLWLANGYR